MFKLFSRRKSLVKSGFFNGFTDYHSHILPSVDDGISGVESALEVLGEYEKMGIRRVVFTPHTMEIVPDNCSVFLRREFEKFKSLYRGNIEIHLASEYMLDSQFDTHFTSGDMLTLWDNYLLVETSYISPPMNLWETLDKIKAKGYFVVLAHPERYGYMTIDDLKRLKRSGILFQLNLLSLSGYYGREVKSRAQYLLNNGMYNLIGSDIHRLDVFSKWVSKISVTSRELRKLQRLRDIHNRDIHSR